MPSKSPLKSRPLRNPGQSLDEELQRLWDDQGIPLYWSAAVFVVLAVVEWIAYWRGIPRQPILYTVIAAVIATFVGFRLSRLKKLTQKLKLGRDGERAVGQYLEALRVNGARIFHDVPATGFNLDHVVISTQGLFVVETKTWSKPHPKSSVTLDGDRLLVDGREPDRNPIEQVLAEVDWLRRMLEDSTGRRFPTKGAVVFPGWWVEPMSPEAKRSVWVLEPKGLPKFIECEPNVLPDSDVALAAYHLGRYVRTFGGAS